MKHALIAAIAGGCIMASPAFAQSNSPSGATKLSQSECTNLWQQANKSGAAGLTQFQAAAYVSDFKAANPDGDTTIDQNEWLAACNKGLVHSSSSTGTSSGASGSDASSKSNPAEHAPTNRMNKAVPEMVPPSKTN